jgi:hypothetical protein
VVTPGCHRPTGRGWWEGGGRGRNG